MRRRFFFLFGMLAIAAPAAAQIANSCGPASGGPVCIATANDNQPVELWPALTPSFRFTALTFIPLVDDAVSLGSAARRFKDGHFSGTITAASFSGASLVTGVTFSATGSAIRGTTTTGDTWLIQGYDNNTGPGYVTFGTITNGNSPTLAFTNPAGGGLVTYNKITLTQPATGATITVAEGKTLTASNTLTFTGTDTSSVAFGAGGTVLYSGGALGTPSSGTLSSATGLPISTGVSGLGANVATALGVAIGSAGAVVVNGGALGTPSSGTLTNAAGLPVAGLSNLGANVGTFLITPSQANFNAALSTGVLPAVRCSNTAASTAITATAAKTYFSLNCQIPANTLAAGKSIAVSARGTYNGNATDTLVLTLDACTVSGCASGTVVNLATSAALTLLGVSNDYWEMDEQIATFTIGASGTLDTQGRTGFQTASTTMVFDPTPNTTTATVDTTVAEFVSISVTFSTNSGNDSITLRNLFVRVL